MATVLNIFEVAFAFVKPASKKLMRSTRRLHSTSHRISVFMTYANDYAEAAEPFHLSQLIYDKRYRGYTIQFITLVVVMLVAGWLINNVVENFRVLGKTFSFSFLWDPASYDINQRLIEYTSRSPHWKAAVVGILNTMVVAVLGCITATVLGVTIGVLRLSKNWLVAKLMLFYIEALRNVPVLIWILVASSALGAQELLPTPRNAEPLLGGMFVATNRGFYVPSLILEPVAWILVLILLGSIFAAVLFGKKAAIKQADTGEIMPTFWIKLAIIVLPVTVMFFVLGMPIGLDLPELKGFNFQGGGFIRSSFVALWLALTLYTAAFIAENVRSGIQAISHGQSEAASSLGLPASRVMRLVILPQALRVIIPPLISQYLNLTKNSSLAIAIGYMDVTGTLGGITLNQTGREMECILLLMLFYLIVSLLISGAMNIYNNSVKIQER